jgi:hypothetical protein
MSSPCQRKELPSSWLNDNADMMLLFGQLPSVAVGTDLDRPVTNITHALPVTLRVTLCVTARIIRSGRQNAPILLAA